MSDTSDEMEAGATLYEGYLEEQEEMQQRREERKELANTIKTIVKTMIPEEAYLPKYCDCANGLHDGERIDCGCKKCH